MVGTNECVRLINHRGGFLFHAKIVTTIANGTANIFIKHEHGIALSHISLGVVRQASCYQVISNAALILKIGDIPICDVGDLADVN